MLAGVSPVADTTGAVLLYETGLPVRAYVPREAVDGELVRSDTRTWCPYKGAATYWSLRRGDTVLEDAAWSYERDDLLEDGPHAVAGLVSFFHDDVEVRIGG